MRKFLTLLLCLLVTPAFAQSWIANAPDQSIPYNNHGYLGYINWTNGCILQYQTGTAIGATGGYPACLTTLPAGVSFPSQAADTFLAAPVGASGVPAFRTIAAADIANLSPTFTLVNGTSSAFLNITAGSGQNLALGANGVAGEWDISTGGIFYPTSDNALQLGASGNRISIVYAVNLGASATPVTNAYITTVTITPVAIASLPTCNSTNVGEQGFINNGVTAPTYHLAVSSTGTGQWPVFCIYNGSTYSWVY